MHDTSLHPEYDPRDPQSIEEYGKKLLQRTLRQSIAHADSIPVGRGKGSFGELLERHYFGINPGNRPTPDFEEAGVELKSTPVKRNNRGTLIAKERLVLAMINYMTIVDENWETSTFRRKNELLLLVFYRWEENLTDLDYPIEIVRLWSFPAEDLEIIRDDWEKIVGKISDGRAHLISEGDTLYLAACVKGAKGSDRKIQPCSDEPAKPRAFSLKASYMNSVISESLALGADSVAPLAELRSGLTFEQVVHERFKPYLGLRATDIGGRLGLSIAPHAKNYFAVLTKRILGISPDKQVAEFEKAGIVVRTMRLRSNGTPKEDVSFPAFDYIDLVQQEWQESDLREQLTRRFFFVIYELEDNGSPRLCRTQFWTMPVPDVEKFGRSCFEETKRRIIEGNADDLPKKSENAACHVRPHGRDAKDVIPLPGGGSAVRKSFWLNSSYLARQLADRKDR